METRKHQPQAEKIQAMFAKVAGGYDQANQILSFGIHHLWRKKLVQLSAVQPGDAVLDCATGTGDLAIEFKKSVGESGRVIGTDFCPEMLAPAPKKASDRGLEISFQTADVKKLPFQDSEFDVVSISFGIRNVENPEEGLREMIRVLKPGGRLMVLEFGQSTVPGFNHLYQFYSEKVLPVIGGWVTGQKAAYQYLQTSSAAFPCRHEFLKMMADSGPVSHLKFHSLTGGVAYIYQGTKVKS